MNVVIPLDSSSRSIWWNPHFISSLENTVHSLSSYYTSSIVGIGWRSRIMAVFACLMSMHILTSSRPFGTTTIGDTHLVGILFTLSIITTSQTSGLLLVLNRMVNVFFSTSPGTDSSWGWWHVLTVYFPTPSNMCPYCRRISPSSPSFATVYKYPSDGGPTHRTFNFWARSSSLTDSFRYRR